MISDRVLDDIIRLKSKAEYIQDSCLSILARMDAGTEGLQDKIWNAHVLEGFIVTLEDMGAQLDEWSSINDEEEAGRMTQFEVGKRYFLDGDGFDSVLIVKRTAKTVTVQYHPERTYMSRIKIDADGTEWIHDPNVPKRWRFATICRASNEAKEA